MNRSGNQKGVLADYFPMIRSRKEIEKCIMERLDLRNMFGQWRKETQEEFLDFCSGERGVKVVYDGIFKEVFNPETAPERLEALLSLILGHEVTIESVLPNDSVRLGAESSLLYTDIVVQQTDGSLSNVEIQKIGYAFPGERAACYSADHLLRQYKRVRGEYNKNFDYRKIKKVYTIVFFEHSPQEFWNFPRDYLHRFRQQSDTGLKMELLQEFHFVALDIYKKTMENEPVRNELEAWLAFLSFGEPERILELITKYPRFKAMYRDIYELCVNVERVMSVYSKELEELDRNTVLYMVDEMQAEIDRKREELEKVQAETARIRAEAEQIRAEAEQSRAEAEQSRAEVEQSRAEVEQSRAEAEQSRAEAEQSRAEAEQSRAEAKQSRAEAEQSRAEAEQSRAEAKQSRAEAEQSRIEMDKKDRLIQELQAQIAKLKNNSET